MEIEFENYLSSVQLLPLAGNQIIAHQQNDLILVYQAFSNSIADFALANQSFGGPNYNLSRMSWIKPSFLWMMYRCGWGEKKNQERVLAIWLTKNDFENILSNSVLSSYNPTEYDTYKNWKQKLNSKEIRMQWDPDKDVYGNNLKRRTIQLGLKGKALANFCERQIKQIDDITDFVKSQKNNLNKNLINNFLIPVERIYQV